MINHLTKTKDDNSHSILNLTDILNREPMHRNLVNEAVGRDDAHKDIMNTIAYLFGMIVSVEIDATYSQRGERICKDETALGLVHRLTHNTILLCCGCYHR